VDGDEQCGELQLPVLHHQVEQGVWFGVVGDPDVLQKGEKREGVSQISFMNLPLKPVSGLVPWPC